MLSSKVLTPKSPEHFLLHRYDVESSRIYVCTCLSFCVCLHIFIIKKYETLVYVTYYVFMRISWICIHICLFGPVKIQEMIPTSWTKYVCWRSFLKFSIEQTLHSENFLCLGKRTRKYSEITNQPTIPWVIYKILSD